MRASRPLGFRISPHFHHHPHQGHLRRLRCLTPPQKPLPPEPSGVSYLGFVSPQGQRIQSRDHPTLSARFFAQTHFLQSAFLAPTTAPFQASRLVALLDRL